jgi:hypothetical protein
VSKCTSVSNNSCRCRSTNMLFYQAKLDLCRFVTTKFSPLIEYAGKSNAAVMRADCMRLLNVAFLRKEDMLYGKFIWKIYPVIFEKLKMSSKMYLHMTLRWQTYFDLNSSHKLVACLNENQWFSLKWKKHVSIFKIAVNNYMTSYLYLYFDFSWLRKAENKCQ